MFKIDHATATADNEFTSGNAQSGIKPTVVTAGWLNAIQRELANFITSRGLALDKEDDNQLTKALSQLKSEADESFVIVNNQASTLMGAAFEFDLSIIKTITINCDLYRKDATQEKTAHGIIKIISKPIAGTVELIQKFDGDEDFGVVFGVDVVTVGLVKIAKLKYTSTNFIGSNYNGKMIYTNNTFKL